MAFDDDEKSVFDSHPRELYKFVTSQGSYYLTTCNFATTYLSNTYTPTTLLRTSFGGSSSNDPPELVVELPASHPLVTIIAFGNAPPNDIQLTIYRWQFISGTAIIVYVGSVTSYAIEGRVAKLRCPSVLDDLMATSIPATYIQTECNHRLYDSRCQMVNTDFDLATTVSSVTNRTVVVASVGGAVDHYYRHGELYRSADGERRMIQSQIGTTLIISAPFPVLAVTNAVILYAGCDHTQATCLAKFNNVANFGGHPFMPQQNPFVGRVNTKSW
jgi:hypothetical protein